MLLVHIIRQVDNLQGIIALLIYSDVELSEEEEKVAAWGCPFRTKIKDYETFTAQVVLLGDRFLAES